MDNGLSKEQENTKSSIDETISKCELEERLLKNELKCYEKIEDKVGKEQPQEAFDQLNKRYSKFKKCLVKSIGKFL